jgi:hypothetical protein
VRSPQPIRIGRDPFPALPERVRGRRPAGRGHLVVDDVDVLVAKLAGKGITFEQYDLAGLKTDERGIAELGPFKGACFKDPDGNVLNVGQGPTS